MRKSPPPSPRKMDIHPIFKQQHAAVTYQAPAYLDNLRKVVFATIGVGVVVIAYVGWWFVLATGLHDDGLAWIDHLRLGGYTVSYSHMEVGGFPFKLRLTVETPDIAPPIDKQPWSWRGETVFLDTRPWNFNHMTLRLTGRQSVNFIQDGKALNLSGSAETLSAEFDIGEGAGQDIDITVAGLGLSDRERQKGLEVQAASLTLRKGIDKRGGLETQAVNLSVDAEDVAVPGLFRLPLGEHLQKLTLRASVLGKMQPGASQADTLAAWRDDGGTVEIDRLVVGYGPLGLNAQGTLALDGSLQPIGAFTAKVEGFHKTVDTLRHLRLIKARDAITAKVVLGVLSKKGRNGGPATLSLPLTLQGQKLFGGPVPLLEIPPIDWPGAPPPDGNGGEAAGPQKTP
ncbi:MAG: DUF2125 domain-containing protein [Rhodospirillales bacterium]|nr:DUF2125 domain-containing protein [Rhodospirillales bacterium]